MTLSKLLACQGIRKTLLTWDKIHFFKTMTALRWDSILPDEEEAELCIPLRVISTIERSPVDFDRKTGGHFEEISVPGKEFPWAIDLHWINKIELARVPVLLIQIWDCVPNEGKRLAKVYANQIG